MRQFVYFADKTLVFSDEKMPETFTEVALAAGENISRAKVLKFFETSNFVAVLTDDPARVFELFSREFVQVTAGGGVVVDERGEWLLIFRNGRWDLPKGHLEPDERIDECAVREVAEETGVEGAQIVRPLCATIHCYNYTNTHWEMKHTYWYEMRIVHRPDHTAPQTEEGIARVEWFSRERLRPLLAGMFPTLRRVLECLAPEEEGLRA